MRREIRALTLLQPWASLIAVGAKRLETRSWRTNYRGPLAIHAGKGCDAWSRAVWRLPAVQTALGRAGIVEETDLPRGCVIAVCELSDCFPILEPPAEPECSFGVYTPGRFAWKLTHVRPLPWPILMRGLCGLWPCLLDGDLLPLSGLLPAIIHDKQAMDQPCCKHAARLTRPGALATQGAPAVGDLFRY
jgi:hypothetical protein